MKFTGLYDKKNQPINVGDVVYCDYDYYLVVEEDEDGNFYGRLICSEDNGCKNIPYHLGDGSNLNVCYHLTFTQKRRDQMDIETMIEEFKKNINVWLQNGFCSINGDEDGANFLNTTIS